MKIAKLFIVASIFFTVNPTDTVLEKCPKKNVFTILADEDLPNQHSFKVES